MENTVELLRDESYEMYQLLVNGTCVSSGNFWDFDMTGDLDILLTRLGIKFSVSEYEYEDGEEE